MCDDDPEAAVVLVVDLSAIQRDLSACLVVTLHQRIPEDDLHDPCRLRGGLQAPHGHTLDSPLDGRRLADGPQSPRRCTVSTGQGACSTMRSAVLPRRICRSFE